MQHGRIHKVLVQRQKALKQSEENSEISINYVNHVYMRIYIYIYMSTSFSVYVYILHFFKHMYMYCMYM